MEAQKKTKSLEEKKKTRICKYYFSGESQSDQTISFLH